MKILKTCRRAIPVHCKLLLVESVLKPSNQPDPGRFNDITMLAMAPGGRERTEVEFNDLLQQAGFTLRVIPATGMTSIVEAEPVQRYGQVGFELLEATWTIRYEDLFRRPVLQVNRGPSARPIDRKSSCAEHAKLAGAHDRERNRRPKGWRLGCRKKRRAVSVSARRF